MPVLSLDAIRLVAALGGTLGRDLTAASLPADAADELLERVNRNTLHAGRRMPGLGHAALAGASRAPSASRCRRARRATSATAGAGCSCAARATAAATSAVA